MLLGRDPDVAVAPLAQTSQLLHLGVVVLDVVLDGQAGGLEDAHVAAQAGEDACALERQQARVGAAAQAAVQHHHSHPLPARPLQLRFRHLQCRAQLQFSHPVLPGHIVALQEGAVVGAESAVVLVCGNGQCPHGVGMIRPDFPRLAEDFGVVEVAIDAYLGRHGGCSGEAQYRR